MSEISQAERTAILKAFDNLGTWSDPLVRATAMWRSGRDYGRERERALEGALNGLFDAARPYLDKAAPHEQLFDGEDLRNFEALSGAIVQADNTLAASPGEPEGQPICEARVGSGRILVSDGPGAYVVSAPGLLLKDSDSISVREDRATEVEKTRIEAWLEEKYGAAVRDLIGEWGGDECWDDDAEELLALVFGDEQQRVEAEEQAREP